jgi:DNA-binding response OmpR family regulator
VNEITLLLAGDTSRDIDHLSTGLVPAGFKVLLAADRAAVIRVARCELPDLILLDLKSCVEICQLLKSNFLTLPIPIIVLLSSATEVDRVVAMEIGADDCMAKPFNFRELTLRIRCSLNRARDSDVKHVRIGQNITTTWQAQKQAERWPPDGPAPRRPSASD